MSDLREDLDRALAAIDAGQPPIAAAVRAGRGIRARRRAVLAAVAAIVAAAAGYPALARSGTLRAPAPVQHRDPVVTDRPGGAAGRDGLIATGRIGTMTWRATLSGQPSLGRRFTVTISPRGAAAGAAATRQVGTVYGVGPSQGGGDIMEVGDGTTEGGIYLAARDVAYLIMTFADGQRIKLIPVTWHGARYAAWAAPARMPVASLVSHLGGTSRDSGKTLTAVPFNGPAGLPTFGLWLRPGQPGPPRATRVITGTAGGRAWSVTFSEGPWGTCVVADPGSGADCAGTQALTGTMALGGWGGDSAGPFYGSAAASVAYLRVRLTNGQVVRVTPVAVGNERVWAVAAAKGVVPRTWTAYSASGAVLGTGDVASPTQAAGASRG